MPLTMSSKSSAVTAVTAATAAAAATESLSPGGRKGEGGDGAGARAPRAQARVSSIVKGGVVTVKDSVVNDLIGDHEIVSCIIEGHSRGGDGSGKEKEVVTCGDGAIESVTAVQNGENKQQDSNTKGDTTSNMSKRSTASVRERGDEMSLSSQKNKRAKMDSNASDVSSSPSSRRSPMRVIDPNARAEDFSATSTNALYERVKAKMKDEGISDQLIQLLLPNSENITSTNAIDIELVRKFYIKCIEAKPNDNPIHKLMHDASAFELDEKVALLLSKSNHIFTDKEFTKYVLEALKIYESSVGRKDYIYANKSSANGEHDCPDNEEDIASLTKSGRCNSILRKHNDPSEREFNGRPLARCEVQRDGDKASLVRPLIRTRYRKVAKFYNDPAAAFLVELILTAILRMNDHENEYHCLNRNFFFALSEGNGKWHFAGATFIECYDEMRNGVVGFNVDWDAEIADQSFIPNAQVYTAKKRESGERRSVTSVFVTYISVLKENLVERRKGKKYNMLNPSDFPADDSVYQGVYGQWALSVRVWRFKPAPIYTKWQLSQLHSAKVFPDSAKYLKSVEKFMRKLNRQKILGVAQS